MKTLILFVSLAMVCLPNFALDPVPYAADCTVDRATFVVGESGAIYGSYSPPSYAGLPSGTNIYYAALISIRNESTGQQIMQYTNFWTWTYGVQQWQVFIPWGYFDGLVTGNQYLEVCAAFETTLVYPDGTSETQTSYRVSCKRSIEVTFPYADPDPDPDECDRPKCTIYRDKTGADVSWQDVFLQWRDQYNVFSNPESARYLSVALFNKAFENYKGLATDPTMDGLQLALATKMPSADGLGLDQNLADIEAVDPAFHFGRLLDDMADGKPLPADLVEAQLILMANLDF